MSGTWHALMPEADVPDDGKVATRINGWHVLLARTDEGVFAVNDRCTHQASRLSTGKVRRGAVMCPLHGARFELASGKCLGGAYADLRRYDLKIEDGMILVCIPDHPPGMEDLPVII